MWVSNFLAPFIKLSELSPVRVLGTFVGKPLAAHTWICFGTLHSALLVRLIVFLPAAGCSGHCGSAVCLEIRCCATPDHSFRWTLLWLSRTFYVLLWILRLFPFHEKYCWCFHGDYIESTNHTRSCGHFNSIESSILCVCLLQLLPLGFTVFCRSGLLLFPYWNLFLRFLLFLKLLKTGFISWILSKKVAY